MVERRKCQSGKSRTDADWIPRGDESTGFGFCPHNRQNSSKFCKLFYGQHCMIKESFWFTEGYGVQMSCLQWSRHPTQWYSRTKATKVVDWNRNSRLCGWKLVGYLRKGFPRRDSLACYQKGDYLFISSPLAIISGFFLIFLGKHFHHAVRNRPRILRFQMQPDQSSCQANLEPARERQWLRTRGLPQVGKGRKWRIISRVCLKNRFARTLEMFWFQNFLMECH